MRRVLGAESLAKSAGVDVSGSSKADTDVVEFDKTEQGYTATEIFHNINIYCFHLRLLQLCFRSSKLW